MKNRSLFLFALLFPASPVLGQHVLLQVEDPSFPSPQNNLYGWQVDFAGDLDQDGYDDFVVSAPFDNANQGRVLAYSGRTGIVLWDRSGPSALDSFGQLGAANIGLIDGDSIPDIAVSAHVSGSHLILSGATGATLHTGTLNPGFEAAPSAAGDIDGDAFGDYLLTYDASPFGGNPQLSGGRVYVMSGATHQPLRSHAGSNNEVFGATPLGDLNGDGRGDYVTYTGCVTNYCSGAYQVYSGIDGSPLFSGTTGFGIFTVTRFTPVGDSNGDGTPDFHWFHEATPQFIDPPSVYEDRIISGATGLSLQQFPAGFPYVVKGTMGDLNNDGRDEFLAVRQLFGNPGIVAIFDPTNLAQVWSSPPEPTQNHVSSMPAVSGGDVNADGAVDILVPAIQYTPNGSVLRIPRRVVVYSGAVVSPSESFCFEKGVNMMGCDSCPCMNNTLGSSRSGCVNSEGFGAILRVRGNASLSDDRVGFELNRGPVSSFALLASGDLQLPQQGPCAPGNGISGTLLDGMRCVGGNFLRHGTRPIDAMGNVGISNASWGGAGAMSSNLLSQSGVMVGQSRYFQAFYRESVNSGCGTGQNTTNAVRVTPRP